MQLYSTEIAANKYLEIRNYLANTAPLDVKQEIAEGLNSIPKYISSKYFYDHYGSGLFEEITKLEEYYLTRSEMAILKDISGKLTSANDFNGIVELGSGDSSKISVLLDAFPDDQIKDLTYYPVDVSKSAIEKSSAALAEKFPGISIEGYVADFMEHLDQFPGNGTRLICFFGSTIGNLPREDGLKFVKEIYQKMKPGDHFLLGLDLVKDVDIIEAAYNDKSGITEKFNKNILRVVNRTIDSNFSLQEFNHKAFYNSEHNRIEMHLEANRDTFLVSSYLHGKLHIKNGETIHTESSHKFTPENIEEFASFSGFSIEDIYMDSREWFAVAHFNK